MAKFELAAAGPEVNCLVVLLCALFFYHPKANLCIQIFVLTLNFQSEQIHVLVYRWYEKLRFTMRIHGYSEIIAKQPLIRSLGESASRGTAHAKQKPNQFAIRC